MTAVHYFLIIGPFSSESQGIILGTSSCGPDTRSVAGMKLASAVRALLPSPPSLLFLLSSSAVCSRPSHRPPDRAGPAAARPRYVLLASPSLPLTHWRIGFLNANCVFGAQHRRLRDPTASGSSLRGSLRQMIKESCRSPKSR